MTAQTKQTERELAFRSAAGIEVALLWDKKTRELTVTAFDTGTGEFLELSVRPDQALDVFNHPFAYAARASTWRHEPTLAA